MKVKTTTMRMPKEMADELAAVARADEMTVSDAVRQAVAKHIAERRGDERVQKRLREGMEEDQKILERLMD